MANRVCLACGKTYEFCSSCPTSKNLPVWKNIFDEENCKTVFEVTSDYAQGVITKDKAKDKLKNTNTKLDFKENIKKLLDEILEEPKIEINTEEEIKPQKIKFNKHTVVVENDWYMSALKIVGIHSSYINWIIIPFFYALGRKENYEIR